MKCLSHNASDGELLQHRVSVVKTFTFEAAHFLPDHPGKCKDLHGHSYKVEVEFSGHIQRDTGMVADFDDIKRLVDPIVQTFDHKLLNGLPQLATSDLSPPPTVEWLTLCFVRWIHDVLSAKLALFFELTRVRVSETATCYAEWRKEDV